MALLRGVLPGPSAVHLRGVPETDGVPARNRGSAGGAIGIDCSVFASVLVLPISISSKSEVGKSIGGGDDMSKS